MRRYILRRILLFIPTFIVITLLSFIILVNAPGDPVERMMTAAQSSGDISTQSIVQQEQRIYWSHRLGLDLPVFYFSVHSIAEPDTLYRIADKQERIVLSKLVKEYGAWKEIQTYYSKLKALKQLLADESRIEFMTTTEFKSGPVRVLLQEMESEVNLLKNETLITKINTRINKINELSAELQHHKESCSSLTPSITALKKSAEEITSNQCRWKNYIPAISFHPNNQYHRWLFGDGMLSKGILHFDFGISYLTKQPVSTVIAGKIGWSLFFTLISVLLAYIISIPLAIKAAAKKNSGFDRTSSLILFMLYSLPTFWVATLLLMTFSNTDVLNIFPASGIKPVTGYPVDANLFEKIKLSLPYLILPTICYTYSSLAFLSRTLRVSMLEILSQDFIRTARAKGLPEKTVLWKHALKNSLLPVITVFANVFPFMIGGSVILESIFTIPGMGSTIYSSIDAQDYPMIVAVFTLTGILTMLGYLLSDVLYAIVDPRISFSKINNS